MHLVQDIEVLLLVGDDALHVVGHQSEVVEEELDELEILAFLGEVGDEDGDNVLWGDQAEQETLPDVSRSREFTAYR